MSQCIANRSVFNADLKVLHSVASHRTQ